MKKTTMKTRIQALVDETITLEDSALILPSAARCVRMALVRLATQVEYETIRPSVARNTLDGLALILGDQRAEWEENRKRHLAAMVAKGSN
jgi:hypothetical protein